MLSALLFHKQWDLSPWNLLNAALRFKFLKLWPFVFLFLLTAELCRHLLLRVLQQLHSKRQAWGTRCFERSPASHRIVQEGQGWTQASGVAGETTTNFSVAQKRAHLYPGGGGEGGGERALQGFIRGGSTPSEVHPLTLLYTILAGKIPFAFRISFKLMNNTTEEHQACPEGMLTKKYTSFSSGCGRSEGDRFPYHFIYFDLWIPYPFI